MSIVSATVMLALHLSGCRGGETPGAAFAFTDEVTVDDYVPRYADEELLYEWSRLDRPRSFFGLVSQGEDQPIFNTQGDISGTIYQIGREGVGMGANQTLGGVLKYDYQPYIKGVRLQMANGRGDLTVRFLDPEGEEVWSETKRFNQTGRSPSQLYFSYVPDGSPPKDDVIASFSWELRNGFAIPTRTELLLQQTTPLDDDVLKAFLYTFGQLTECYDADVGLVSETCRDESGLRFMPDASGLFALATAIAEDLNLVEREVAIDVVTSVTEALLALPRDPNTELLPAHSDGKTLSAGSHWSSLSTVVALEAAILASEALGQSSTNLERAIADIQWDELTTNGGVPISAGFDSRGDHIGWRHGVFGGKAALLQIAHAATEGDLAPMDFDGFTPTWDGAGYDNELAALLFPMDEDDYVGNDWVEWRDGQFWIQRDWTAYSPAGELNLFGISACEVPEPWALEKGEDPLRNFGVGGHNQLGDDGFEEFGYTVTCPHYPAMVMADYRKHIPTFATLFEERLLSPMTAVESIAVDGDGKRYWNHRKNSWSLALQSLGLLRALSGNRYLPYQQLPANTFLRGGYEEYFPRSEL